MLASLFSLILGVKISGLGTADYKVILIVIQGGCCIVERSVISVFTVPISHIFVCVPPRSSYGRNIRRILQNGMKAWCVAHMYYKPVWTFSDTWTSWHWPRVAIISPLIGSSYMFGWHQSSCSSKLFFVINITCHICHIALCSSKACLIWSIPTRGCPGVNILTP